MMSVCHRPLFSSCISTSASTCSLRTLMRKLRRKSSSAAIGSVTKVVGEGDVDESERSVRNSGIKMVSHEFPRAQRALAYCERSRSSFSQGSEERGGEEWGLTLWPPSWSVQP